MWQCIFRTLRRQPGKNALASGGFLLAACALILLSATTQTTVVQANQIISQSWRSSYDLVVLPSQAHLPSKNSIPGDLLEGYDGGISMQQYQQIKNLPGIAVAAPIAYIGYIQMPIPQLQFFTDPSLPDGYYRVDLTLTAFNGQREVVENKESIVYYYINSCDSLTAAQQDALAQKGVDLFCAGSLQLYVNEPIAPGTFLMAAIDPAAENQLVHLDKSLRSGRMLTAQALIHLDINPNLASLSTCQLGQQNTPSSCYVPNDDIPVLFQTQLPGQSTIKSNFTKLASSTLSPQKVITNGGAVYLNNLPHQQSIFQSVVPQVQSNPQRFSGSFLRWDGHSWQPIRLFLAQALLLAIGGGIVGVGLALLISSFLEITPIWLIVIWTIPVMLAFALISVIYPLWRLWRMQPTELLRAGSTMTSEKVSRLGLRLGSLFTPIGMLVVRNLVRSRPRTLITILSLFFSALLLMVMFNGVLALRQTLIGTLLGNYVLLQTAVPQIAGCVFALLLTFLSVSDLLLLQVRTRQQEIGLLQAIGWRPWAMQQLFILEGLTLAVIGTVPGVLVSLWVLAAQHSVQNIVPLPLLACGAILLMLLVSALAILPALRAINRMQVVQVLRSE